MSANQLARGRESGPAFTRTLFSCALLAVCTVALAAPAAFAQNAFGDDIANAFTNGEFDLNFRYRYEFVDTAGFAKNANASTLRTRLVYKSAPYLDTFVTLNLDDLRPVIGRNFNDTRNGKTQYPVVADPKGTDLNLASLTYTGLENATFVLGRQRIIRANHRYVGNVGWRQNEQTYDSLSAAFQPIEKLDLYYAYVDRVKRIFGPDDGAPTASFRSDTHLLDAAYTFNPAIKLLGYAYLMKFNNAASLSNRTFGIRATGSHELANGPTLSYQGEFASQEDYKNNPVSYDANYYLLEGSLAWQTFGFKLGFETLEGDGTVGRSFRTPLATLHKFNGWADQFLTTPPGGLEDFYLEGNIKLLQGNWRLIYHNFSANTGGADYADELDFVASWKLGKHYSVLVKFALYSADQWSVDNDKFWVQFGADF